ncbi:major latex allergen Hev b 5-like [Hevea brasiliensis]|uniref:major latex allergen Hev b 5-like n=1 Tax=Hevea brasiliensis TaxID=3981 RepID=UPI0025FAA1D5|nr:major latex allergen Hev b 5-like [Hevea brasiliensis]
MARDKGKGKAKIPTYSSSDSTDASVPASPPPQKDAPLVIGKPKETPKKRTKGATQEKGTKKKKTSKAPVVHMERAIHEPSKKGSGKDMSDSESEAEPETPAPAAPAKGKGKTAQQEQRCKQKEETAAGPIVPLTPGTELAAAILQTLSDKPVKPKKLKMGAPKPIRRSSRLKG